MPSSWSGRLLLLALVVAVVAAAVWALRPQPVPVDTAAVARGVLEVVVTEEGRTRVRDVYVVSAAVAGTLQRSPRKVGEAVKAGETVVAVIRPSAPGFLDVRGRREAEALIAAVQAMVESGRAQVSEAEAQLARARSEHARTAELHKKEAVSESRLEEVRTAFVAAEAKLASANATLAAYQHGLTMAQARLVGPHADDPRENEDNCCLSIY